MLSLSTSSLCSPLSMASARCAPVVMGFGPSPKELSDDQAIPEVLKVVKREQAERFARAQLTGASFAVSLPGVTKPFGFFDPFNLIPEDQDEILLWREAEITHGRVSMLVRLPGKAASRSMFLAPSLTRAVLVSACSSRSQAAVGFLAQQSFHPLTATEHEFKTLP